MGTSGKDATSAQVDALVCALEARDPAGARHSRAVVELAVEVARRMGLPEQQVREVEHVAAVHDVGKLTTPDRILHKPGALDDLELAILRQHAAAGAHILSRIPALAHLAPAVRATHERWDGGGYPYGLAGGMIPLPSRITFVCDAYDAMTSARTYRPTLELAAAAAEVRRGAGTQFCPRSSEALLEVLAVGLETALAG